MARVDGDIVITVGGNVLPLTGAVGEAVRTLGNLNKATSRADKEFRAMVGTSSTLQSRINALTGFSDRLAKSAEKSASAFEGFRDAQRNVDRLRASYDPLFAASKRYETEVEQLDDAMAKGVITQAQYASLVEKLAQKQLAATSASGRLADGMTKTTGASRNLGHQVQNASYQVGDFFVQIASGTDATRALAQQLPQLLGGFGMAGAVLGAAAAIGGALVPAIMGATEKSRTFSEALGEVSSSVNTLNESAAKFSTDGLMALKEKYGEVSVELLRFLELQRQSTLVDTMTAARQAMDELYGGLNSWTSYWQGDLEAVRGEIQELFDTSEAGANDLYNALLRAKQADTFDQQLAAVRDLGNRILKVTGGIDNMTLQQHAFYRKVLESEDALRLLSAAAPKGDWMNAAIGGVNVMIERLKQAVQLNRQLAQDRGSLDWAKNEVGFTMGGKDLLPENPSGVAPESGGKGGGGGGGKKEDPKEKLADFQKTLMTEGELEALSFQERLKQLQEFNAAKLLSQTEYNATLEKLQQQHQDRMAEIDVYRYGDGLQKAGAFMGDMASALQSGNEKMQKISQKFAAAEALVNAWRAFSQTLADPSLPFAAKFKAAGSVFAAAMGAVKSIKSGSETSAGKSSSAAATGGQQAYQPVTANIHWQGDMTPASMTSLTEKLNREYKQGYRLNFVGA